MTEQRTIRQPAPTGAVPIEGVGARLAANMTASLAIPTATSFRDIPVDVLVARRRQLNVAVAPARLSFTHLVAYAVAQAAAVHRALGAHFVEIDGRPHRVDPAALNLGLAVDVVGRDGGSFLLVPVVRGADELDFAEFLSRYDDLVSRARAGRLSADDLFAASLTLTNPGTVGTTASVPRLMPGQGAIVAIGAIHPGPAGAVMTISSTYDHRVIQGAESGRFLAAVEQFLGGADEFYESIADSLGISRSAVASPVRTIGPGPAPAGASPAGLAEATAGVDLVRSFRQFGHRAADLDPLGSKPPGDEALEPESWGLSPESLTRIPAEILRTDLPGKTLADVVRELRATYCGPIAYEVEHINDHEERSWLRRTIETGEHRVALTRAEKIQLLERLTSVEAFERFLGRSYLGQKRFSIEGLDVLVPMLDRVIELAGMAGARTVEIGMSHRGRLSALVNVVGIPEAAILEEFERGRSTAQVEPPAEGETSDVKYHRGAHGTRSTAGGPVRVTVSSNPSHLEAIDPVVEGRARAEQSDLGDRTASPDSRLAVPVLIHGDAAFAAQGVVAETFNLARLAGYTTGGTIHLIGDNQLGFTVEPSAGRSTDYASDLAKGFDVPIAHVNADDPEACLSAVQLAVSYRNRFHGDFVIHVLGYRRHGHSEEDEPAYTQPRMYERVAQHPTVREIYLRRLVEEGALDPTAGEAMVRAAQTRLSEVRERVAREVETRAASVDFSADERSDKEGSAVLVGPSPRARRSHAGVRPTSVRASKLRSINDELLRMPAGFTVHAKLAPQLERRRQAFGAEGRLDWAHAESLALASLVLEGVPIRLTGQDTERGTFSQRHLVLHDPTDGRRFAPIEHLSDARAAIELHDSPLSELACLGFEYGFAVEAPNALVLWEAQYGDFANGAEVVIDQFIIAGLAKWGETSRLTLLLPHGYEGQGPEHSSARLERFLALGAEDNVRVANCTTPAQYFHLLRDQALRPVPRPLVLMTPKSLLRLPAATSRLGELSGGRFEPVLDDPERATARERVRRLVLCSGRFYYDLLASPRRAETEDLAIARVELLYPFPARELGRLIAAYPALETVVWAQEEPRNMGARKFVLPEIRNVIGPNVALADVSRPERSSPAEGYASAHRAQQRALVEEALG